jgi:hypothetical protein
MKHLIGYRNMVNVDLFFTEKKYGTIVYLIVVDINTRKCFAEPTNIKVSDNADSITILNIAKTTSDYLKALSKVMEKTKIKFISADQEKAFTSSQAEQFYKEHDIKFIPVEVDAHNILGILNRICRTIRDMAYRMRINRITPDVMAEIMHQYNNSPHTDLTKIMKVPTSPNDVAADEDKMIYIYNQKLKMNEAIENDSNYELNPGTVVKFYRQKKNRLDKRRAKVYPDLYTVVEKVGHNIKVKNNRSGETVLVPRYEIS